LILRCERLSMMFGGLPALKEVDLEVRAGDIHAVIGPNGAGKTTLFNVINGVYKPTSGKVFFENEDITGKPSHVLAKRGIARTLQIPRVFADMTVYENVYAGTLFGRGDGKTSAEDIVRACQAVGLDSKMDVKAGKLNLQERKKLELARALASHPKLMLIDEYMSGLTPAEISDAVKLLKEVRKTYGTTILWVEHVISAVASLADKVTVLNHGMKIAEGRVAEIMRNTAVIEAYLGGEITGHA